MDFQNDVDHFAQQILKHALSTKPILKAKQIQNANDLRHLRQVRKNESIWETATTIWNRILAENQNKHAKNCICDTASQAMWSNNGNKMVARLSAQAKAQSKAKSKGLPSAQQAKAKCGAACKRGAKYLLCAAARRKHRKRPPEPSGDDRKPWKCHLLGHLKFQHFHF